MFTGHFGRRSPNSFNEDENEIFSKSTGLDYYDAQIKSNDISESQHIDTPTTINEENRVIQKISESPMESKHTESTTSIYDEDEPEGTTVEIKLLSNRAIRRQLVEAYLYAKGWGFRKHLVL